MKSNTKMPSCQIKGRTDAPSSIAAPLMQGNMKMPTMLAQRIYISTNMILTLGGPTTATITGGGSIGVRSTNGTCSFLSSRSMLRRPARFAASLDANANARWLFLGLPFRLAALLPDCAAWCDLCFCSARLTISGGKMCCFGHLNFRVSSQNMYCQRYYWHF